MTQVRKLYSLILKDSEENYYRLKINDEYFHTLPTIDTYTTQSLNKQCFLEGRSYELKRDIEERGRSLQSVCEQYLTTVRPMHEQFIEPSKKYAHIIIPEGGSNHVAVDLLTTKIKSIIDE